MMKKFAYYVRFYYQTRSKHGVLSKAYRWATGAGIGVGGLLRIALMGKRISTYYTSTIANTF